MKAYVVSEPGGPEALELREVPDPEPRSGWVLIRVRSFGLNRSELYTRRGDSGDAVPFPRVLGIECVGEVVAAPDGDLAEGQKVAAAMGQMGRQFDGGYAEYTLVPRSRVYPIETDLPWHVFGAIPETFFTAWGVLVEAMEIQAGQTVLIRGGTSSVGMAAITICKDLGCTVLATTRQESKRDALLANGVDHVVIDTGKIAEEVRRIVPGGVHSVAEMVGTVTSINDSLASVRPRGFVGLVGMLGDEWFDQAPFPMLASTVRLTMYSSETLETNYGTPVLAEIVKRVEQGRLRPNIDKVFAFDDVVEAHRRMQESRASGKLVVTLGEVPGGL